MPEKKSKFEAGLACKCPRCRQGDMFVHHISKPHKFMLMHEHCPNCGLRYQVEPGFFFGAMYISYAFSIAILLSTGFVLYNFFDNPSTLVYIASVVAVIFLFLPFTFRYSRVLFLYWFGGVHYDERYHSKA